MSIATEDLPAADEPAEPQRPPAAGPMTDIVTAVVVVVLGGAALAGSINLDVGTLSAPGPGTWPALVSVTLMVLGAVLAARARQSADAERFTGSGLAVLAAVVSMAVYVAVIGIIGFEIPSALLAFVWLRWLGRETWRTSIVLSVAVTAVFYALFVATLDVTIPHLF
jgi:putative tricarboxylic transport membrane protein